VPVRLEDCNRGDHRLTMYQQFDLFTDWNGTLDRLAVMLGGRALSAAMPAPPQGPEQRQIDRLHGKAAAFFFAGDFQRAFETWNQIEALGGRSAISLMNKGLTLMETERLEEAITAFDEALSIDSEFYPAWANKGAALVRAGRLSEAITAYGKALEIKPEVGPLHWVVGETLGFQGKDAEALAYFSRAVDLSPEFVRAWYSKGVAHLHLQDWQLAAEAFEKVVELEPTHYEGWSNLGTARLELSSSDAAINAYQRACALRPQSALERENLGVAHSRAGHHEDALKAYDEAVRRDPSRAKSWSTGAARWKSSGYRNRPWTHTRRRSRLKKASSMRGLERLSSASAWAESKRRCRRMVRWLYTRETIRKTGSI
jgi:tetratricopeptide (TPR) repeat protein